MVLLAILVVVCAGCGHSDSALNPEIQRIALFQMAPYPGEFGPNQQLIEKAAALAAREGTDIFVTPELAESGYEFVDYCSLDDLTEYPSPWLLEMAARAKPYGMTMFIGFPQKIKDKYYNAVVAISREGKIVGVHQKIDIIPSPEENWATPGDTRLIYVDGWRIGYFVCADAANDPLIEAYRDAGADLLLSSAAWYPDPEMGPEPFWANVSREIDVPFFIANTTGRMGKVDFRGSVCAVYHHGTSLLTMQDDANVLYLLDWNPSTGEVRLQDSLPVPVPVPVPD